MPVTKKKGAVFAIFADSPISTPQPTPKQSAQSPTKKSLSSTSQRKALQAVQPSAIKGFPQGGKGLKSNSPDCGRVQKDGGEDAPIKAQSLKVTNKKPPTKSAPTKRQFEIFSVPPDSSSAPYTSIPARDRSTPSIQGQPENAITESPIKKNRASPRKIDKENINPESPSSNTRSKTVRSPAISSSSRGNIARDLEVAALVGSGRGTLSLKKGRMLAGLIPGDNGLLGKESASGSVKRKGLAVEGDAVLADVSEAYGAEGAEPEGFRA